MCGLAGFWQRSGTESSIELKSIIEQMTHRLVHRGPDDKGTWVDPNIGLGFGHRRLAILDLSPEGHQPMTSENGRYIITFNGEIYNYLDLRQQLIQLGHGFRGHSDTEVLLAGISQWGVQPCLSRCVGMFAFALWDQREQLLYLGRDRLGEKPLYYGWQSNQQGSFLFFASELKAIHAHPYFYPHINRDAITLLLRYNYIPSPYSIYTGIYKLPPGTLLTVSRSQWTTCQPQPYWCLKNEAEQGIRVGWQPSDSEAIAAFDHLLRGVVSQQMVADVPLGAFLSGGVDSSTIVALMQAQSDRPVKTFTIGFHETKFNEAERAREVAHYLGCDHTDLYVTAQDCMAVIPQLPSLYDEPFADSSQIPTFLVSQLARQHVTVSLSGDGGDELLGGYSQYFWGQRIWHGIRWLPFRIRQLVSHLITQLTPQDWNDWFDRLHLPSLYFAPGESLYRLAGVLKEPYAPGLYRHLISQWQDPASVVIDGIELPTVMDDSRQWIPLPHLLEAFMNLDGRMELPDQILVKVDRATMGVGLESRAPLLDHRVAEFACKLPLHLKVRRGQGKWLLRQVLHQYVPAQLVERPKMGFSVPLNDWLRSPELRDWVESLLAENRLKTEGFFHPQSIRRIWEEHQDGRYNWKSHLWNVLMFQSWLDHWQ
ncbi:MAG: asparagine synthase (glutamine-hydrolyzing) [Cyanobacteria bacterium WB6_1B_304]|nr:asparagine synthase (glutamine-hydrolyzing) [Cyanobacteria bacterium WB6_1B_304]